MRKTIDADTLRWILDEGQPVTVLDVRPAEERAEWSIPDSVHVDAYDALKAGNPDAVAAVDVPRDRPVVTVCGAGQTSLTAAEQLQRRGIQAASLDGGMQAWSLAWNTAEVPLPDGPARVLQVRRTGKGCLSYLIGSDGTAAVIDPALDPDIYLGLAREQGLNDGMVWGVLPLFLAGAGLSVERIGIVAAVYPGVWGLGQLVTGALSDRLGRKWMIVAGLWVQAAGILMVVTVQGFALWVAAAALMGLGTALVYPTLLAAISDVAHPAWRASSVGVYRLWRDGGYAVGALLSGVLADALGLGWAIGAIGGLTAISGIVVATVMYETLVEAEHQL